MASGFIRRFLFDPGLEVLLEIESVNVLDLDPPASISGIGTGTVLIVGEFENGDYNTPTEVASASDLSNEFGQFGYSYNGVVANNPSARSRQADGGNVEFWNGNGMIQLNGKKFRRLVICRVNTSIGEVSFSRLASLSGLAAFRYDLEPAQTIVWEDGSGPTTATFSATAGIVNSVAGVYPTAFVGGETLTIGYDSEANFTVTFLATDQTITQVIDRINQYAGFTFVSTPGANLLRFTGRIRGTLGQARVVSASAGVFVALGLAASTVQGTGNVANIDQVTADEINTIIGAASGGNFRVTVDSNGALRMENVAGGDTGTFRVVSLGASALGFPLNLSSTADSNAAVYVTSAGVYPTTFAGGETLTLGVDDDPNFTVTFLVGDQTIAQVISRINTAAGYTLASQFSATRIRFDGVKSGGQVRVVATSAPLVNTALGVALVTVDGQPNLAGRIPAGTRVRVPLGASTQQFVTTQDVAVTADSSGPYTALIRHATDDGTGIAAGAGTITQVEVPIDLASFDCINLIPANAALSESALDAQYDTAIDATQDLNSIAKIVNVIYSARQSNAVRAKLKSNALEASSNGHFGRMACLRPPLGTTKALAKSTISQPGVGATRDQRVIYCYPGLATRVPSIALRGVAGGAGFTADGIVDAGSDGFMASIMSQLPPEENPGQETAFTTGAVSLESSPNAQGFNINDYIAFRASGIAAPRFDGGVMFFQSGVTSVDPLVYPNRRNIARRRMADFIQDTLAQRAGAYAKKLNTVARRRAFVNEVDNFLAGLLSANNPAGQRIAGYSIDSKTGNTPSSLALGVFRVIIKVQTLSSLDSIVLEVTAGESVDVSEAALVNPG